MGLRIGIDALGETISKELGIYSEEIVAGLKKETKSSMEQLVQETKSERYKQPTGGYTRAISSKVVEDKPNNYEEVWYVKPPHHTKAHLLENGHAKVGGGRTIAYGTIARAMARIEPDYAKRVEAIIRGY